jgi:hypothetical protein
VEKYIPIRIQSQISETLNGVLPRSQLNKLDNYEMEKFNELNLKILDDDGSANLAAIMREIMKEVMIEQEEAKRKGMILGANAGASNHTFSVSGTQHEGAAAGHLKGNHS